MSDRLFELEILALDCQASGATPAHGDLLELGWTVCSAAGEMGPVRSRWIVPRTKRRVPRAIRELTGWSRACVVDAIEDRAAWSALCDDGLRIARKGSPPRIPTVIHFARFELGFLRDLQQRCGEGVELQFDAVCLHAVAQRLFPDLPRRNIRALAGYLGHSPELMRRSAGHVEATAFIWRALVPLLDQIGITSWEELGEWLTRAAPISRRARRVYPLAPERRRALPNAPGVYRFVRRNGDVLYVGKAVSLKKRVASHFTSGGKPTERALELLTQVHDVEHTLTASLLEAALLETDEIKRLDPPYNVQLRSGDRSAWFVSRDLRRVAPVPDGAHPIGPLPSSRALAALRALIDLAAGAEQTPALRAQALGVPAALLPDDALFSEGWRGFSADHLGSEGALNRRLEGAALALWLVRGRAEPENSLEDAAPDVWDLARVRRRLERNLVQTGLLLRRTRWLCLLAGADVAFREPGVSQARALILSAAEIVECHTLDDVRALFSLAARKSQPLDERQRAFDAAAYDRVRVLLTELRRIRDDGGEVALRVGRHPLAPERLSVLLSAV
jgi:DNA polymerase-3 subunit epsilon